MKGDHTPAHQLGSWSLLERKAVLMSKLERMVFLWGRVILKFIWPQFMLFPLGETIHRVQEHVL